jgi:hypothetical protein
MRTLYESILDDEQVISSQSMKRFGDVRDIVDISMSNDAFTDVQLARYFKWNDIKNYCKKNGLKPVKGYSIHGTDIGELPAIILNVPYIGFEQNILVLLKGFLKSRFTIAMSDDKWTSDKSYVIYNITKPTGDPEDTLEMIIWFREKKS